MFDLQFNKILVPVDFSDPSRKAFYAGIKLASQYEADAYLLHVTEKLNTFDSDFDELEKVQNDMQRLEDGVRRRLDRMFDEGDVAEADRRRVKFEIRGGKPWLEIVRFAVEHDIDLIVMATHGHSGIKHLLIGSTAERVLRRSPCACFIVKPDDFDPRLAKLVGDFVD